MSSEDKDRLPEDQLSLGLENSTQNESNIGESDLVDADDEFLEWVCHPAKRNLKVTAAVSLFLVSLLVIVYYWTYSFWFVALGAVILFASLASFYFPTRYILSTQNIKIITKAQTQEKKWEQYRTCYPDKNGVLLSPFTRPSRLENFRGVYLRFWNNKDEVMSFVKRQIEARRKAVEEN